MNTFISPFQMRHNKVVRFKIEQDENFQDFISTKVSLGADFTISGLKKEDNSIIAYLNLMICLQGRTEKDENVFTIELDMRGEFDCDLKKIEEDKFVEMLKLNGVSTLMQLSRAYITSATALSGFEQPINFPMVNVHELIRLKETHPIEFE